jgi:hypothetical protein
MNLSQNTTKRMQADGEPAGIRFVFYPIARY